MAGKKQNSSRTASKSEREMATFLRIKEQGKAIVAIYEKMAELSSDIELLLTLVMLPQDDREPFIESLQKQGEESGDGKDASDSEKA